MSYATPSDIKLRYDSGRLGQLVRDDGTEATAADLDTDPVLQAVLDDSHGMIDAAVLAGHKYDPADLQALAGTGKSLLLRLNCDLAYGLLILRKGFTEDEAGRLAPGFKLALQLLDRLRNGDIVFNVTSAIQAGLPVNVRLSDKVTLISSTTRLFGDLDLNT